MPKGSPAAGCPATASRPKNATSSRARSEIFASSARTAGSRSALATKPALVWQCIPIMTFWSTDRLGKSARFWKVRLIPSAAMRWDAVAPIGCPSNASEPADGS